MPTTTSIPRAILDALELGSQATRGYVLAAAERALLDDDGVKLDRLLRALGITGDTTPSQVLKTLGSKMSVTHPVAMRTLAAAATPTVYQPALKISDPSGPLGLLASATDAEILAELRRVEALQNPTQAELDVRGRVRQGLGLTSTATTEEVLAAATEALAAKAARIAAAEPATVNARSATSRFEALADEEFRVRNEAPRSVEDDDAAGGVTTAAVRAHHKSIHRQADDAQMRTRAAARRAVALKYPELAEDVAAERSGVTDADINRFAASKALGEKFTALLSAGKSPQEATAILNRDHATLVRTRSTGQV